MSKQSFITSIINNMNDSIRFCMPSHNGKIDIDPSLDITELDFSDNLQNPMGIIKQLEDKIAKVYNVDSTLIFTAGATSAIATALAVAKQFGDTIAIDERAHKSIFSYAKLFNLNIIDISELDNHKCNLAAILLTSPDYFGMTYAGTICRQLASTYGVPLIVDQSHGGHYVFSKHLPQGLDSLADITINSLHKTLPVLTGGAIANVKAEYADLMKYNRALVHTTSPSYLVMSSIEMAIDEFSEHGECYYELIYSAIRDFKATLSDSYELEETDDYTRVVITSLTHKAQAVNAILISKKIYIEMTYLDKLVLIITPYNYQYLPVLKALLNDIALNKQGQYTDFFTTDNIVTHQKSPLIDRAPLISDIEFLPLADASGRILANDIGIYPPGIPLARGGEPLDKSIINLLLDNPNHCFGLVGEHVACLRRKT